MNLAIACLAVDLCANGIVNACDVQRAVTCAQSGLAAVCDFNGDGVANVVDVQIAVLLQGCDPGCSLLSVGGCLGDVCLDNLGANEYGTWSGQLYSPECGYSWAMPAAGEWCGVSVTSCGPLGCVVCE